MALPQGRETGSLETQDWVAAMAIKGLHLIDSGGMYGAEAMLLDLVQEATK